MSEPIVIIVSVNRSKISDEIGMTSANVVFKFDVPISEYVVMDGGSGNTTGTLIEGAIASGYTVGSLKTQTVNFLKSLTVSQLKQNSINANQEISITIDYTELTEGNNRINIYGKSVDGIWTSYNQ